MTTPTENSKAIVERFMRGEFEALADEAVIWLAAQIPVTPDSTTDSGWVDKKHLLRMMASLNGMGCTRYRVKTVGLTAEGARVAVEAEGHIELKSGRIYANKYHILFVVQGDKITSMREYSDTRLVKELFGR